MICIELYNSEEEYTAQKWHQNIHMYNVLTTSHIKLYRLQLYIHFTSIYNTEMDGQQTESTTNVPGAGNQQQPSGSGETGAVAPKSGVKLTVGPAKKSGKSNRLPKPAIGGGGLLAKLPKNLSAPRGVIASADRLPCERCHQEQRPFPPDYVYLWIGRCTFQGLDIYIAYRRLRQDNLLFYQADHGTCIDITEMKLLDGKLVKGPPEDFSRQRMVSFGTIMDSAKNIVRRKFSKFNSFVSIF